MNRDKYPKHTKEWFVNRVGKEIAIQPPNLFNTPIKIQSQIQAAVLYTIQSEKGYRYTEI